MPSTVETPASGVGAADFQTINFSSILSGSDTEKNKLLTACEKDGFFYLDVREWRSGEFLQQLDQTNLIMTEWFAQPLVEKMKTKTISDAHGFKPPGIQSGVNEDGRDGWEALRISREGFRHRENLPAIAWQHLELFDKFQLSAHSVLKTLLSSLSDAVGLIGDERYEASHPEDVASKSTLFFLHHPISDTLVDKTGRGHNAHTDVGSFTLLFTHQPGLQVLSPTTGSWEYVPIKPGHAIINVADTLRFMSKRRFRSALHRVLPPGGKMARDRYSTAYFLRAGDSVTFTGLNGEKVTANEWFLSKYSSYNKSKKEQMVDSIATGGMERDLGATI